jgi:hypothetical protein
MNFENRVLKRKFVKKEKWHEDGKCAKEGTP